MVLSGQKEKFESLIRGTVLSLCQNVLDHQSEIKVEVFVGISLDQAQAFHFSIVETLKEGGKDAGDGGRRSGGGRRSRALRGKKKPIGSYLEVDDEEYEVDEEDEEEDLSVNAGRKRRRKQDSAAPFVEIDRDVPYQEDSALVTDASPIASNTSRSKKKCPDAPLAKSALRKSNETLAALLTSGPKAALRDVTASQEKAEEAWSYSNLLRSFGEMSRQQTFVDPQQPLPVPPNSIYSEKMSTQIPSSQPQAQVVIPINFAIHSPSKTAVSAPSAAGRPSQSGWSYSPANPQSALGTLVPTTASPPILPRAAAADRRHHPADQDPGAGFNPFLQVKQEQLSDDEGDPQSRVGPLGGGDLSALTAQRYYNHNGKARNSPAANERETSAGEAKRKGILLSLLSEESQFDKYRKVATQQARTGAPHTSMGPGLPSGLGWDPLANSPSPHYPAGLESYSASSSPKTPSRRRGGQCRDQSSRARRIILLTNGPYASIRMVHRSLQGMRSGQIMDIMTAMSRPRGDPLYVGEFKVVPLNRVRQGRREAGVFYKCPPDEVGDSALEQLGVSPKEYATLFRQVFKYDRMPQREYFLAVAENSPFRDGSPNDDVLSFLMGSGAQPTGGAGDPGLAYLGAAASRGLPHLPMATGERDEQPLNLNITNVISTLIKEEKLSDDGGEASTTLESRASSAEGGFGNSPGSTSHSGVNLKCESSLYRDNQESPLAAEMRDSMGDPNDSPGDSGSVDDPYPDYALDRGLPERGCLTPQREQSDREEAEAEGGRATDETVQRELPESSPILSVNMPVFPEPLMVCQEGSPGV